MSKVPQGEWERGCSGCSCSVQRTPRSSHSRQSHACRIRFDISWLARTQSQASVTRNRKALDGTKAEFKFSEAIWRVLLRTWHPDPPVTVQCNGTSFKWETVLQANQVDNRQHGILQVAFFQYFMIFFFLYMSVSPACMCAVPTESRKGPRIPWSWSYSGCGD